MKQIIALTIGILISSLTTRAQSPDFTVLLDENMHYVVDMLYTTSGNFVIAGTLTNQTNVYTTAISKEGEILWSNFYYGQMLWYANIIQKSDGNILIPMSNYNPFMLEINQSGDSVGCVTISETNKSFFGSVIEMPDSSLIATEIVLNNDPFFPAVDSSFLVKLSPECCIIDKYPSQFFDIKDIISCSESSLFAITEDYNTSIHSHIVKYNLEGQVISTSSCTVLNPYLHSISRLNSGYFFALGYKYSKSDMQAVLAKFDINGQIMFCNEYSNNYFVSLSNYESSEKLYILGQTVELCTVKTLDYSGNIISDFIIDDSLTGNNIIFLDNYLYIAAVYNYCTAPRSCLIKIHKDSILSVNENHVYSKLEVYPNPASNYVIFEYQAKNRQHFNYGGEIVLQIMNIFGKLVNELPVKSGKTIWNTGKIKSGIYFYTLNVSGVNKSGKIVISR